MNTKLFTLLALLLCGVNSAISQELNNNFTKEELIKIRKSKSYLNSASEKGTSNDQTPYLWEYVIDNNPNGNEEFSFCDAKELSNGNIGVASSFYYRSGYGDFYSAHPAVAVISRDGEEIARNSFFRPGYTTTSSAPYLFEKEGKLFALSTYSPEHDYLSFNYFQNYADHPGDARLVLSKLDDELNIVKNHEHCFTIDTFEKRGWEQWEYLPNEHSGNICLFSAFEDEGNIIGAFFKIVSLDYENPRGHDSLFLFRMNFDGEIIDIKGYERESHGGFMQAYLRRNQMIKTDSLYILYESYYTNYWHGRIWYFDKQLDHIATRLMRHCDYPADAGIIEPLKDLSVIKDNNGITYLSTTANNIINHHSSEYNDSRLYKLNDDLESTSEGTPIPIINYIIRGSSTARDHSPNINSIDIAPNNTLYYACNYNVWENIQWCVIERLDSDLDSIRTLYYDKNINSLKALDNGNLMVNNGKSIAIFPATVFGFEPDNIEEAHAHNLHLAVAYPNPGGDVMNIRTGLRNAVLSVYDINGRKIHEQEITDDVTSVDASGWDSGTYVWKLGMRNEELGMKEVETGKWVK